MTRTADQAYLDTRVSMMAARLFDPDTIADLALLELPALAARFGLTALLDHQPSPRVRGRAIEQAFVQLLLAELEALIRPMHPDARAVVLAWGRKYALFNLKTLIRGKLHDLDQQTIRDSLFDLPAFISLPDEEMLRAENVLELLRQLEAGPLRLIALQAREVYAQRREPFALEAAIDQRYYTGLAHRVLKLQDGDAQPLKRVVGADLDRVALLWLLRFRFSYQLSPSETFYQLVPSMRLLHRERLLALVDIETFEGVLKALPAPLAGLCVGARTVVDVQRAMGHYRAAEARRILHQGRSAVARALACLMLREMDLMLLFALVQGRLLNLPDAVIDSALDLALPTSLSGQAKAA